MTEPLHKIIEIHLERVRSYPRQPIDLYQLDKTHTVIDQILINSCDQRCQ